MKDFLHIGVLRGGRLVDDRYVPEKGEVTVGSAAKNTFALIGSNLPKEHLLWSFKQKHPTLHVTDGMNGEVALDGKSRESLGRLQGKGRQSRTGWELDLPETGRGWVSLGDTTFFFHVTYKPPPPPRKSLPEAAKTGLFSGIEKTFTAALAAILLLETGGIIAIHRQPDVPIDQPTQEDLDRFAQIIMPEKPKDQPKKDDAAKKAAEEAAKKKAEEEARKKDEKKKDEAKKDESPEDKAAAEAAKRAKIAAEVSHKGLLNVLGSSAGSGALANVFASSAGFGDDVGKALAGAGGVKIASGDDAALRKGASGPGGPVGIGDLGANAGGGHRASLGEKKRVAAPEISVSDEDMEVDSSTVDKGSLGKYIKYRLPAIKGCYNKELKLDPSLKGKIVVRFVITTQGRVSDVSIDENTMGNDDVAACIKRLISTWFFPLKPAEDAPVSFPFLFSPGG